MAYVNDPSQGAAISEANNPAARAFALGRIQQLVNAHLLGAMPSNVADPAAVWRGLSQGLGANHTALLAFLAAGQHPAAQHSEAQQQAESAANVLAAHLANQQVLAGATDGAGGGQRYTLGAPPAPQLVSENGGHTQQSLPGGGMQLSDHRFLGDPGFSSGPNAAAILARLGGAHLPVFHGDPGFGRGFRGGSGY